MQEDKGKGDRNGGESLDPIDIIGVDISLKTLQESITAVCIDKLGFTWDMRYGELIKHKEQIGDFDVSSVLPENKPLINWVNSQRTSYQKRMLSKDRIKRLEDIGFEWNLHEAGWNEMYNELIEYMEEYGDCNVPEKYAENKKLANWVQSQRTTYLNGRLSENRIKCLEEIGFIWKLGLSDEEQEEIWEQMFDALKEYKKDHVNCNVPTNWIDQKLLNWTNNQRTKYKDGSLSEDCIKRLEEIGFEFDVLSYDWEMMFNALEEYISDYENCDVPYNWPENELLRFWIDEQRALHRCGKLHEERVDRLEEIGLSLKLHSNWEEMLEALKQYKNKHGDCNVPSRWTENKQLAKWVRVQCISYQKGKLSIKRLESIGVEWNIRKR